MSNDNPNNVGQSGVVVGSGLSSGISRLRNMQPRKLIALIVIAVFAVIGIVFLLRSLAAVDGRLYVLVPAPTSDNAVSGEFSAAVRLNAGSNGVNVVDTKLAYDATKLDFVRIDATNSAFDIATPGNGGSNGVVTLTRAKQTGVTGDVLVALVVFRTKATGSTTLSFSSGEAYNTNDSTNVINSRTGVEFGISTGSTTTPGRLYFNPSSGSQTTDFSVDFRIDAKTESVSALDARLTYDNTKLELLSIDDSQSAFETRAPGGNTGSNGNITIIRGHQAGVTGDKLVVKLNFRPRAGQSGSAALNITSGEALRAVGGTNIIGTRDNASYTVGTVVSPTPGRLYFNPSTGSKTGDFPVELRLDAKTESVSAIDVRMTYDNTKLELVSMDDSTSAFETRAPGGNTGSNGTITVIRGHQAGVTGDKLVVKLNFRVRAGQSGPAAVNITSGEALRAVGGTNIVGTRENASFTVSGGNPTGKRHDLNNDGLVNAADVQVLFTSWNQTMAADTGPNFNNDTVVNRTDLQILYDNFDQ